MIGVCSFLFVAVAYAIGPHSERALTAVTGERRDVSLDLSELVIFRGATVLGINGRKMFETWYQMENLILSEQLELDSIITHQIEMKDFETGFAMMQSGEAIKVVMKIPQHEGEACQTANSTSEQLS